MRRLFLDDIRVPEDASKYMPAAICHIYREEWDIVRSYDEFTEYILKNGLPDVISFDHDLADIHYDPSTWKEGFEYDEKTGYDCAKWLADFCTYEYLALPDCYIHSANPVGSENIRNYLENYKRKKLLEDIMKGDEELGLYNKNEQNDKEI